MSKEYEFQALGEEYSYRQFPNELENDKNIYFHGTAEAHFDAIKQNGFLPKFGGSLDSISFAKNSSLALNYACEARNETSPNGIIIMVDISNIMPEVITGLDRSVIHLAAQFQPKIIGYCVIPKTYIFK
ncbi:hypothetical protein D3C80_1062730 [compost metagenome]